MVTPLRFDCKAEFYSDLSLFGAESVVAVAQHLSNLVHQFQLPVGFKFCLALDCGWYVNLQIGKETSELQFMAPREPGPPACNPAGLMYNFSVDDVDAEYDRLTAEGLTPVMPLEDHPWGDRGFAVLDPNGITLYIYYEREPSEEFKQYVKD